MLVPLYTGNKILCLMSYPIQPPLPTHSWYYTKLANSPLNHPHMVPNYPIRPALSTRSWNHTTTSLQPPQPLTHGSNLSYSACLTNTPMVPYYN